MFLGLDLAWKVDGNNSTLAVLTGDEHAVQLKTISDELRSLLDIESFVEAHSGATTVLAVDASLVVMVSTKALKVLSMSATPCGQPAPRRKTCDPQV